VKKTKKRARKQKSGRRGAKKRISRKLGAKKMGRKVKRTTRTKPQKAKPVSETKTVYIAPRRTLIKDAVCELLPHIDPSLIKKLDYWALYTIHQDVVKDNKDREELARRLIKGYVPEKGRGVVKPVEAVGGIFATAPSEKELERARKAKDLKEREEAARKKAIDAKERARAARLKARAAAHAAKARERAARAAARAKRLAAKYRSKSSPKPAAAPSGKPGPKPAASKPASMPSAGSYVPPPRIHIRDDLTRIMPMIKKSDLTGLDYWQLYTMHSEIVKYGRDPESMARKFIKGYARVKK